MIIFKNKNKRINKLIFLFLFAFIRARLDFYYCPCSVGFKYNVVYLDFWYFQFLPEYKAPLP